jgi:DNA-binding CsgD family transcriptional regulator
MKHSVALAHFRQLSCLGLEGRQAVSAMMAELPNIVPGTRAVLSWVEADGTPKDLWVCEVIAPVLDRFVNQHDLYVGAGEPSLEMCALSTGPMRMWDYFGHDFMERSNTYQDVFRNYRMAHNLSIPLTHGGRPIGLWSPYRDTGDRDFTDEEEAVLRALARYLRHAMLSADEGWDMVDSDDRGVILCDVHGRILSQSDAARRLLHYAANGHLDGALDQLEIFTSVLPRALAPIIAAFAKLIRGEAATPPRMTLRNAWGVFEITAQSLSGALSPTGALDPICLIICRKQPLPLRVVSRLRDEPLSDRQKQLALHLALDRSVDQILDLMGITAHTYRDHVRAVYAGLGVTNRAQLLGRLIG